jgi:hypothetical protein
MVESAVCPSRLLEAEQWTTELIDWWLWSARWTSTGMGPTLPLGAPRWPRPGGLLHQRAWLVDAVKFLSSAYPEIAHPEIVKREPPKTKGPDHGHA